MIPRLQLAILVVDLPVGHERSSHRKNFCKEIVRHKEGSHACTPSKSCSVGEDRV